jgi:phosphonate transport system substrate-binding protein
MKKFLSGLFFFTMVLTFAGCGDKTALDANGIPGKLVIAHFNSGDAPALKKAFEPLRIYLEKKLGMEVEYIYTSDYTAAIEGLRSKKVHIAYLSPFSYVLASQKHDITPIIAVGKNGAPNMYRSVIFTNNKTGLNSIEDLKARSKNFSLCFVDPASTSGHLIPRAYLTTIGLNPDNGVFKQTIFAGSHLASVLSVTSGKIDVGCSAIEYGLSLAERRGLIKQDQYKILWVSDPIVSSPLVVRNDLNKDFVKKIQSLFINLKKDAPDVFNAYIKLYYDHPEQYSYLAVQDSMYNGIRKIAGGIKDLSVIK